MKSVQGDSGHARMDMVADVYSHIIDEDGRYNAQKFEEQFYNTKSLKDVEKVTTAPMPKFETVIELQDHKVEKDIEETQTTVSDENTELIAKLLSDPQTAALLKAWANKL